MKRFIPVLPCALILAFASVAMAQTTPGANIPLTKKVQEPTAVEQVQALVRSGQSAKALARADEALAANPKNAQLRFMRGVLLGDLNRVGEAKAVFEQLTQDYPELPEPYNNLAAILAGEGQLAQAEALLKSALDVAPNYATARENLGDLYVRMAAESYAKAAQLAPGNRGLATKLGQTRELLNRNLKR